MPTGEVVDSYVLTNAGGASVQVLTYGARVHALRVPDRQGDLADVVLGCDDLTAGVVGRAYFGAMVGRIAGRVREGKITADGRDYLLPLNEERNHLHGGPLGLDRRVWTACPRLEQGGNPMLQLTYLSLDGESGYPGEIEVSVTYTLSPDHELIIETRAYSKVATPLCLTHHSYFNLGGEASGTIADHELQIFAGAYVPVGPALELSNRAEAVIRGKNDLNLPRKMREVIPQLHRHHGDLYLLRSSPAELPAAPAIAARLSHPPSGRVMNVYTDEPCLQFYTGVALDGSAPGKSGVPYGPYAGLCLECQGYPEASTVAGFGNILVQPERPQRRRTVYAFSVGPFSSWAAGSVRSDWSATSGRVV